MKQPEHCTTRGRPVLVAKHAGDKVAVMFRPRCGMWSCPYCAIENQKLWAARTYLGASKLAAEGFEIQFATLTSHERLTAAQTFYVWPAAWKKLYTRLYRMQGSGHQYVMVPERHEDGRLHVHAICTWTVKQWQLKDNARECGLGYMAEIEPVEEPAKAAWYVSKYLSKGLAETDWPENFRRVRVSRGWPREALAQPLGWRFRPMTTESMQDHKKRLEDGGYTVVSTEHNTAWKIVQFIERKEREDWA